MSASAAIRSDASNQTGTGRAIVALPDRTAFSHKGVHLNAAYTHVLPDVAADAGWRHLETRRRDGWREFPVDNDRDAAAAAFAALIGADPREIAIVPSTNEGENLIAAALDLGPGAGVVTDSFHYSASLAMYGERHKLGMPLTVIAPSGGTIDYGALEAAIVPGTRLVAVTLVSSLTGHTHDLRRVCEIAHARGALVFADIIQAAGAMPIDVRSSGVDFCCAGTYKWLMGDFGAAFLYVRADRLAQLRRVQLGWRGVKKYQMHALPSQPPGPAGGDWSLATDTAGMFEVSTPAWGSLTIAVAAMNYISSIGVDRIAQHRAPLLSRLQDVLPGLGYTPLTPRNAAGPFVAFEKPGLRERLQAKLTAAQIAVTLQPDKIRIAPSVHNGRDDIEQLIEVLSQAA
ncbi:aminotransferase class V-fold PLP-dependent enzyme [Sphingomonas rustica]|uniref:aminotransferase class V-fold PLP-dependent enzyme n=1 Tax=Sphingomonas rustica TaxID=3103142 RepID=UPI0031FCA990